MKKLVRESLNESVRGSLKEEKEVDKDKLRNELERIKERLRYLSQVHHPFDDNPWGGGTVRDIRNRLNYRKEQILDIIQTPEQKEKKSAAQYRASEKRWAEQKEKRQRKEEKLKTLTPKQEAINNIIDLQYRIRMIKQDPVGIPKGTIKNTREEIEKLKDKYNIKSYDLRRQKEYDPEYE